jgi:hypothetical protein
MKNAYLFFIGLNKDLTPTKIPFPATGVLRSIQTKALMVADIASDITVKGQIAENCMHHLMMAVNRNGGAYE